MIRGTTPTHTFNLPFDTSLIDKVRVLYAQNDAVILVKNESDCVANDDTITLKLTQEETFLFDRKLPVEIQVRILCNDGTVLTSVPYKVGVLKCLQDEVLV